MSHVRPPDDTAPQPIRTRGRLEDGAVGLHAERVRRAAGGNGRAAETVAPLPLHTGNDGRGTSRSSRRGALLPL
ncbi:MAG TPA: hypothetical protein VF100_02390, partial [Thermoanaerobaculia bacterium]